MGTFLCLHIDWGCNFFFRIFTLKLEINSILEIIPNTRYYRKKGGLLLFYMTYHNENYGNAWTKGNRAGLNFRHRFSKKVRTSVNFESDKIYNLFKLLYNQYKPSFFNFYQTSISFFNIIIQFSFSNWAYSTTCNEH